MFKPSPALPERQSKEDAAIAMETARPIMWFGEDGQEVRLGGGPKGMINRGIV